MSSSLLPQWHPFIKSSHGRISCHHNGYFHSFNSIPGIAILFSSSFLIGLVFYTTFLSSPGPLLFGTSKSYGLSQLDTSSTTQHLGFSKSTPPNHPPSSHTSDETPSFPSDVLSLEQIRDIVATTRGFFTRDYSLNLGWNNVSMHGNPIRVELIIPE
jgi:hypothetical protein